METSPLFNEPQRPITNFWLRPWSPRQRGVRRPQSSIELKKLSPYLWASFSRASWAAERKIISVAGGVTPSNLSVGICNFGWVEAGRVLHLGKGECNVQNYS